MKTLFHLVIAANLFSYAMHAQILSGVLISNGSGGGGGGSHVTFNNTGTMGSGGGAIITSYTAPSGGGSVTVNCTGANYALVFVVTYSLGSDPHPSSVYDSVQGSGVPYTALGTPVNSGTTYGQWFGHSISGSLSAMWWTIANTDYSSATPYCVNNETAVDSTSTFQSSSATGFNLPSITPAGTGEMFLAGCSDESTSVAMTISNTGWATAAGNNTVSGTYGQYSSYRAKSTSDSTAESPTFNAGSAVGGSCMMVALK